MYIIRQKELLIWDIVHFIVDFLNYVPDTEQDLASAGSVRAFRVADIGCKAWHVSNHSQSLSINSVNALNRIAKIMSDYGSSQEKSTFQNIIFPSGPLNIWMPDAMYALYVENVAWMIGSYDAYVKRDIIKKYASWH